MQEMIRTLCKQLRLGSHIAETYSQIQADSQEAFLVKVLTEAVEAREVTKKQIYPASRL